MSKAAKSAPTAENGSSFEESLKKLESIVEAMDSSFFNDSSNEEPFSAVGADLAAFDTARKCVETPRFD